MQRQELEVWLGAADGRLLSVAQIAQIAGLSADDVARAERLSTPECRRTFSMTLAILRDVYVDDADIRRWLRAGRRELEGRAPLSVLLTACASEVVDLAAQDWSRGAMPTVYRESRKGSERPRAS
jgi:hypothetical protein